ncbi:MAG: hypothetical protein U0514_00300 [Candidatus Andersenbacteria bacterium]
MRETIPVRTKQEDWPFLCDADTIKHGKVYVARQDHRQSGARFKRGAVLIRARFSGDPPRGGLRHLQPGTLLGR